MTDTPDQRFEIRLSVRQLVEFLLRSGDIDNRRSTSPEKAMQEGSRLHRMIQRSMGVGYQAEVPMRYLYETPRYVVQLDGRADGVINEGQRKTSEPSLISNQISINEFLVGEEFDRVTIDEIKCVNRKLTRIRKPVPVHLAQAKVYAFIYAVQHKLPFIRVRMTYCNIRTEDMKYFFEEYILQEITAWFEKLMKEYEKWADFQFDWYEKRQASIRGLNFPFPYREGQKPLTAAVYRTVQEKKKLFLEAPTGVGKTICTMYPSIRAMGEGMAERIFYLTAKTITRTVAADTLDILRGQGLEMKSVILTAKEKACPLEKARCNPEHCPYAGGHYDRVNEALYEAITTMDALDRDNIAALAEKHKVCPFELSLDISTFMDTIICDYNYVFDPHACLKRYFADGASGNYIFLVDEAHNLVDRGRDMYSAQLVLEDVSYMLAHLRICVGKISRGRRVKGIPLLNKVIMDVARVERTMKAMKEECRRIKLLDSTDRLAGCLASLNTSIAQFLEEEENTGLREDILDFWFDVGHFLLIYERVDDNYRMFSEVQEDEHFRVKLLCVNPRKNLAEAMARGRSSILFSATLLPVQYYKLLLGGEKTDYEIYARSAFDKDKLGVFIDRDVTSRYSRRGPELYTNIARHIHSVIGQKPGNYMVFFPSYRFLTDVYESYVRVYSREREVEVLVQGESMTEEEREEFLSHFFPTGLRVIPTNRAEKEADDPTAEQPSGQADDSTAEQLFMPADDSTAEQPFMPADDSAQNSHTLLAFCVSGGLFSEGIDLREDALIGSIIVGTCLPLVCNEREIIKEFFEENGFDYAYRFPGMNKVLQAAGRVIRTEKDTGVVVLMDERFTDRSYQKMFPREWAGFYITGGRDLGEAVGDFWESGQGD